MKHVRYIGTRVLVGVCIALVMMLVHNLARAQAGSNAWGTWSTSRAGGVSTTTLSPPGGGAPLHFNLPSAVGGTVTGSSSPLGVKASKPIPIPFQSSYGAGGGTLAATAERTILKAPLLTTAARLSRLTSPLGWAIMAGSAVAPYLEFSGGELKTNLAEPGAAGTVDRPLSDFGCWKDYNNVAGMACKATADEAAAAMCIYQAGPGHGYRADGTINATIKQYDCNYGTVASPVWSGDFWMRNFTPATSCPGGYTQSGTTCSQSTPGTCPSGYVPGVNFFYPGESCTPSGSPAKTHPLTESEAVALMDYLTGNDPTKLASLFNDVASTSPFPSSIPVPDSTNPPYTTSGPSSMTPTTTSTPTPSGRTDTTITPNVTYNQNVVTITENVVNNYYDQSGALIGSDTNPPEEEEVVNPATDSTLPGVTDFYTQKYPAGFGGVWSAKSAALMSTPFSGLITALTPSLSSTGTCPVFTLPSGVLGLSYSGNVSPPCFIWDVIKVILIVTALFMARRIIFGG